MFPRVLIMPTIFCCNLHHPGLFLFSLDYFVWIFIKLNFFFFSRHIFCFYFWNCHWFCTYYGHFIFLSKFFLFCSFSFSTVQLKFIMYLDLRYSLCFLLRTFFILLFFKYIIFPIYIQNLHMPLIISVSNAVGGVLNITHVNRAHMGTYTCEEPRPTFS